MELRLADDNNEESTNGGLRLTGENNLQTKESEYKPEKNPWDYEGMNETSELRSFSQPIYTSESVSQPAKDENIVIKIGMFLVYICMILQVVAMIWISTQNKADVYVNLMKFQGLFGVVQGVIILDAILVNILYKKKISLIFVAWLLNFLYPIQRSKHVGAGETLGKLCTFGTIVGTVATIAVIFEAVMGYGGVLQITDEATRAEAVVIMDQLDKNGQRIGDKIMDEVFIEEGYMETQAGTTVVVLVGNGSIKMDGDTFVDTGVSSVETYLAFTKMETGIYEIQLVVLGDTELTSYGAKAYWNAVIQN